MNIGGEKEMEICAWIGDHAFDAKLSQLAQYVEFEDEELALIFRIIFGL
jgi:hypothetical protein